MSTPVLSPEAPKKEFSWKRLFIKAAGFGAGVALMLTVLAGVFSWYVTRPKPPKSWDTKAITATFDKLDISNKDGFIGVEFHYSLQNNTDEDYTITGKELIRERKVDTGTVEPAEQYGKTVNVVLFAKHKATYDVLAFYTVGKDAPKETETTEGLNKFLYEKFHNTDGFTLFDQDKRYEIVLPNGWKDWKKP
jgi:hypothetical protein